MVRANCSWQADVSQSDPPSVFGFLLSLKMVVAVVKKWSPFFHVSILALSKKKVNTWSSPKNGQNMVNKKKFSLWSKTVAMFLGEVFFNLSNIGQNMVVVNFFELCFSLCQKKKRSNNGQTMVVAFFWEVCFSLCQKHWTTLSNNGRRRFRRCVFRSVKKGKTWSNNGRRFFLGGVFFALRKIGKHCQTMVVVVFGGVFFALKKWQNYGRMVVLFLNNVFHKVCHRIFFGRCLFRSDKKSSNNGRMVVFFWRRGCFSLCQRIVTQWSPFFFCAIRCEKDGRRVSPSSKNGRCVSLCHKMTAASQCVSVVSVSLCVRVCLSAPHAFQKKDTLASRHGEEKEKQI